MLIINSILLTFIGICYFYSTTLIQPHKQNVYHVLVDWGEGCATP